MTNQITIVGNLTRSPELRFLPSGAAVVNFGVASNRRWMNKQTSEWEEQVSRWSLARFRMPRSVP